MDLSYTLHSTTPSDEAKITVQRSDIRQDKNVGSYGLSCLQPFRAG